MLEGFPIFHPFRRSPLLPPVGFTLSDLVMVLFSASGHYLPALPLYLETQLMAIRSVGVVAFALVVAHAAWTQEKPEAPAEDYVKAHYTKYEYRIPMRDGVRLFTSVYVPKDQSHPWPFMVDRTPYSVAPYGEDQYKKEVGPSDEFEKAGYIFVYQDVRGRYMSEGKFIEMRPHIDDKKSKTDVDDSSDMSDTVDWLG